MANKRSRSQTDTSNEYVTTVINVNGRIVIPVSIRKAMGLKPGDALLMRVERDLLIAESQQARVRRVQQSLARLIPADRKLSDELIAERRQEAQNEMEEWLG
jgi:antitoxin PrlF